jgi:hypothetical protein
MRGMPASIALRIFALRSDLMSVALTLFALVAILIAGCATSSITAFKDPALASKTFSRVGVFAVNMNLEAAVQVEQQICEKLTPVPCEPGKQVIPPTRQFTGEEVHHFLEARGIDAVLIVGLAADQADTRYAGSVANASTTANTTGTISAYGNTGWYSGTTNASTTATSTPIYDYSRVAFGDLNLYDAATGSVAWAGQIKISGQGMLNVTDNAFISSATAKIAQELKATGFFPLPKNQ